LAAEYVTCEARAEIAPGGPIDRPQEARRADGTGLAREGAHGVVERALAAARLADLAVEPVHDEGRAVVERGRLARPGEVEAPAPVAREERHAAGEAPVGE